MTAAGNRTHVSLAASRRVPLPMTTASMPSLSIAPSMALPHSGPSLGQHAGGALGASVLGVSSIARGMDVLNRTHHATSCGRPARERSHALAGAGIATFEFLRVERH